MLNQEPLLNRGDKIALVASAGMILWMFYMFGKSLPRQTGTPTGTIGVRG